MTFIKTGEFRPGLNKVKLKNISEENIKVFIETSTINQSYFQYSDNEVIEGSLLITPKSVQACIAKPHFNCEDATYDVAIAVPTNTPFIITINDTKYIFENIDDFIVKSRDVFDAEIQPTLFVHEENILTSIPVENVDLTIVEELTLKPVQNVQLEVLEILTLIPVTNITLIQIDK